MSDRRRIKDADDALVRETAKDVAERPKLKDRHLYMIAMGGCIGTAFLVGSGRTLSRGGPALTVAGFVTMCSVVWVFATLMFEMATFLPLNGAGVDTYATRLLSESFGFAMGWNYWYAYAMLVPFEITAAALVVGYWQPPVSDAVFITILFIVITGLNYLPVGHSGEAEFAFSSVKLSMLTGIMILSVVIAAGGGPTGDRVGFRYWRDPGPANAWIIEGGKGKFLSFLGEMIAICGGETGDARKSIPKASKALIIRLICFSVLPIFGVTLICPSNAPQLTSGGAGAGSSPFVIGIKTAGIHVLDHIVNAVILCSAWSAGNVYMYLASRSIYSLAVAGNAPRIFTKRNRWGVPYWAVTSCTAVTLLAYLNVSSSAGKVFNWFINMINMAAFFSWIVMSCAYIRLRAAMKAQSIDRSTLPYISRFGKPGAYLCIVYFTLIGLLNGFSVFLPGQWKVSDFLTAYIGTVLFIVLYVGHKLTVGRTHAWIIPAGKVDLISVHEKMTVATADSLSAEISH
ncbi:proline permease PrnB [Cordyceps javanica]|uniref:Proline permease PrnB n=1 Tax=Cordyceps javanica TaxID=43265 RepID=A0A545VZ11_9HYPO|nr:proline permease PrnB [Cordyceps javanica]TQW06963.1 proline permease PrnB [Cordyceps javanica]